MYYVPRYIELKHLWGSEYFSIVTWLGKQARKSEWNRFSIHILQVPGEVISNLQTLLIFLSDNNLNSPIGFTSLIYCHPVCQLNILEWSLRYQSLFQNCLQQRAIFNLYHYTCTVYVVFLLILRPLLSPKSHISCVPNHIITTWLVHARLCYTVSIV